MSQDETKSPNDKLAALIIEKLAAENLVPRQRLKEIEEKLALGTARPEDWRVWVEMTLHFVTGGTENE